MLSSGGNICNIKNPPIIKRELVTKFPDPGQDLINLIGWLKKRAGIVKLSQCNKKWKKEGINIEDEIRRIGADLIRIYRTRGGEKVVKLMDSPWADQWSVYYGVEIPHHGQYVKTKRKLLETERKV